MRINKITKLGLLFAVLLVSLTCISISYSGLTSNIKIGGTVETFTATGNCKSTGFWKHNFKYYLTDQGNAQVSEEKLMEYCNDTYILFWDEIFGSLDPTIGNDNLSFQEAYDILSSTSSDMEDLLRKQLMASELNYVSDDYQADNNKLFGYFIRYSEKILINGETSEYEEMKNMLKYYNNLG